MAMAGPQVIAEMVRSRPLATDKTNHRENDGGNHVSPANSRDSGAGGEGV